MHEKRKEIIDTNLSQAMEAADDLSTYDTNVKYLLADRQVLARILKYAVEEFQDMPIRDIMQSIGDDVEVGEKPIDAGLSNLGRIRGSDTEDNIPGEGKIFFDIRFTAYRKKAEMKFLINVEAQKSSNAKKLGYHLENRIIFYLSRMISAQKQTEFYHSDYDSLKKVRSIWICMDTKEDEDSIEEICLCRKAIYGKKTNTYDAGLQLMKGIIINIREGEKLKTSRNKLIAMLESLLSSAEPTEKKRILSEEYGMIMTTELEGRLKTMCNLSENIADRAMEKAKKKAMEQAEKEVAEKVAEAKREITKEAAEKVAEAKREITKEATEKVEEAKREIIKEALTAMISGLRDVNIPDDIILQKIQEKFNFSLEQARTYL